MALATYAHTVGHDITPTYSTILPYNPDRTYFEIQNRTGDDIFITLGGSEQDNDALLLGDKRVFFGDKLPIAEVKVRGNVAGRIIVVS